MTARFPSRYTWRRLTDPSAELVGASTVDGLEAGAAVCVVGDWWVARLASASAMLKRDFRAMDYPSAPAGRRAGAPALMRTCAGAGTLSASKRAATSLAALLSGST